MSESTDSRAGQGRSNGWKHLLVVLAIFVGGFACGFAVSLYVLHRGIQRVVFEQDIPDSGRITTALDSMLELSDEQELKIHNILDEEFSVLRVQRKASMERMLELHGQIIDRISQELDMEQREKLHRHLTHIEQLVDPEGKHLDHMQQMHDHMHGEGH